MTLEIFSALIISFISSVFSYLLNHWLEIVIVFLLFSINSYLKAINLVLGDKLNKLNLLEYLKKLDWLEQNWKENYSATQELEELNRNYRLSKKFRNFMRI